MSEYIQSMLCRFFGVEKSSVKASVMKTHGNLKDRESWRCRTGKYKIMDTDPCLMKLARILYLGAIAPKRHKQVYLYSG